MADKQSIEIRTFGSPQEIRDDLPNFIENNPISKTSYKRIIGDYHFREEVCCCFEKDNKNLCGEGHKKGWVAELQDGSATIIGNHCAKQKFGADSSLIADRGRYINEKRRLERLSTLNRQIEEKAYRLERLNHLRANLKSLETRVAAVTEQLGSSIVRRLQDMARMQRSDVSITAVKLRPYVDDNGQTKHERSSFLQSVGSLGGLDLIGVLSFSAIFNAIRDVERAYKDADKLDAKPKSKDVNSLANRLNEYDRILRDGDRLLALEQIFLANNFLPLCYLVNDKGDRYKAAKFAMNRSGISGGKDDAKAWLAEQERSIKQQLGINAIEMR